MDQLSNNRPAESNLLAYFNRGSNTHHYIAVDEAQFHSAIAALSGDDVRLINLFCAENFRDHRGFALFYVFEKSGSSNILVLERHLAGAKASSIAGIFSSACWFEREVRDGFGIDFPDAFDKRRLFLHEVYPDGFHPLLKSFRNQPVQTIKTIAPDEEYRFKEMAGEGVYQIPVGPVHAGIIEPGHFRFSVIGETIFNLEIRMFYKHRGIEKLAEGRSPAECVAIAESVSGDETVANAVAFCMAVEKIRQTDLPLRAWQLRTILLEMERIYSHLGDLAGMIVDVAFPVGASNFFILREEVLRQNKALTGSRFMKGIICPGGLSKDVSSASLEGLNTYLNEFVRRLDKGLEMVHASTSVIDRLETTGVIKGEIVGPLNITGPAARAAGVPVDSRFDHPYGLYPQLGLQKRLGESGDVLSRLAVKAQEIKDSVSIIQRLVSEIKTGPICSPAATKDGYALSIVEAARGQNVHWVYLKNGLVDRYKVRTASFCTWQAIEHAVLGNIVPDFPLINKSLNLSYAGTDL